MGEHNTAQGFVQAEFFFRTLCNRQEAGGRFEGSKESRGRFKGAPSFTAVILKLKGNEIADRGAQTLTGLKCVPVVIALRPFCPT